MMSNKGEYLDRKKVVQEVKKILREAADAKATEVLLKFLNVLPATVAEDYADRNRKAYHDAFSAGYQAALVELIDKMRLWDAVEKYEQEARNQNERFNNI